MGSGNTAEQLDTIIALLKLTNRDKLDSAREKLTAASHKLAEQMYKATQPTGAPGAGPSAEAGAASGGDGQGQKKDEGVIDAEYVDVEDKK